MAQKIRGILPRNGQERLELERQVEREKRKAERERRERERKERERALAELVGRFASYLVTHDGYIVATFAREDDALLFEAELAELDLEQGVRNAKCEVLDRRGRRAGGYLITAGRLCAFLRDEDREQRFGRSRRDRG